MSFLKGIVFLTNCLFKKSSNSNSFWTLNPQLLVLHKLISIVCDYSFQAKFESLSTLVMATFFSLTTPVGIAIGIGISSVYKENSPTALIVEGCLNSASAGILIYMALVDLLAADFMNSRMQSNVRLQLGANVSLLLGAACMSVLAKWAWISSSSKHKIVR